MEALARAGDKKYSTIIEMSNTDRVVGMLANVLGEETELEVIKKAVAAKMVPKTDGDSAYDEYVQEQTKKNWLTCWTSCSFKDLHGFPCLLYTSPSPRDS